MESKKRKLLVLDIDGVMTDNKAYVGEDGRCFKPYSFYDWDGITQILRRGWFVLLLSAGDHQGLLKYMELYRDNRSRFFIHHLVRDKLGDLEEFMRLHGITWDSVFAMGNDVRDYLILEKAAVAAVPADSFLLSTKYFRTERVGGAGAAREFIEYILDLEEI